jgi:L-alanine-DL-glutamate epimerase-like enolase superfamily enzyme
VVGQWWQSVSTNDQQIKEVEARLFRVPINPAHGDAIQSFDALELPTVQITDGAGRTGFGFAYTIGTGGRAMTNLLRTELCPKLPGMDCRRITKVMHFLKSSVHALTPGCISSSALAAIDIALWDLCAKVAGTPLYKLLGGAKDKVLAYNTDVGWLNRSLDEMVALSQEAVNKHGFKAVKLKVGKPDAEEDEQRVAAVRKAIGPHTSLMLDANQSWFLPEAIKRSKRFEKYDIVWLEEPVPATNIDSFVRLGLHSTVPRAGGESLYAIEDFFQYLRQGALDVLQPDAVRIGGITNTMKVCALAQAAGLPVAPHVSPELSVTIAAAVPNSIFVEYIPQMEPILAKRVDLVDGYAVPPDVPGHGVKFDGEAMARLEVKDDGQQSRFGA